MIPFYPDSTDITMEMRDLLHPRFQNLADGVSEYTFANIYLFRETHNYRISKLENDIIVISGSDENRPFFMIPFEIPGNNDLDILFKAFGSLKAVPERTAQQLLSMGYKVVEDRDNFDYVYSRQDLAGLAGRKYHKKRNLIKAFVNNYEYEGKPLLEEYIPEVIRIINLWKKERDFEGDYKAAVEAVEKMWDLQLCGGIYYVDKNPVAYTLGEEIACGKTFLIHFEKAIGQYKGIYQFINRSFSAILPEKYETINREQDLGNEGLRHAKMSYYPADFIKKYRVTTS